MTTEYCAATDYIFESFFLFVESLFTDTIHLGVLDELLNQNFNRWSRSDTIIQTLIEKIVNNRGFIAPVAVIFKQRVICAVHKALTSEPPVLKKILSTTDRFPSASTGPISDAKSNTRHPRGRRHDRKDLRHCNSWMDSCNERKKQQRTLSSSSQTKDSLKTSTSEASRLNSQSCSRSTELGRRKRCICCDEESLIEHHLLNYRLKKTVNYRKQRLANTSEK